MKLGAIYRDAKYPSNLSTRELVAVLDSERDACERFMTIGFTNSNGINLAKRRKTILKLIRTLEERL